MIGPPEPDGGEHARAVVEREPQVIGPDASRSHRSRIPYAEDRSGIPRPTGLEMPNQSLQLFAHARERQLEIDALAGREIVGREQLARDAEERRAKRLETVAADSEARGHGVTTVFLEMRADAVQRAVQVESGNAATGAPAKFAAGLPADQKRRPAVALDESRRHDAEHDGGVGRRQRLVDQLDRLIEDPLIHLLTARVDRLELARERGGFLRVFREQQSQAVVRITDAAGRIEARREDEADVGGAERLASQP